MQSPVEKMKAAGFALSVEGEKLIVEPGSRLTAEQTAWIRAHKAELMAELRAANDADAFPKPDIPRPVLPPHHAVNADPVHHDFNGIAPVTIGQPVKTNAAGGDVLTWLQAAKIKAS